MARKGEYNGHHCWNCWNVALWIGNDEGLYRLALECKRRIVQHTGKAPSLNIAVTRFLNGCDKRTPDGAKYTRTAVKHALEGLE
jgi:hypothetical protein